MNSDISKYTADWFTRADEDLKLIEILLREDVLPNTICFHAQQAGEKYLKGFLAFREKQVRKIHDLLQLVTLCKVLDDAFDSIAHDAESLTKFYVETRYPADVPDFSFSEAQEAFQAAAHIKQFVLSRIEAGERKQKNGFTLLGILIVIAVIALGGGGLYLRETQQQKAIEQIGIEKMKEAEALKQKIEQQQKQIQAALGGEHQRAGIVFGNEAEKFCGPQPPASCRSGMTLGCWISDKRWDCYPIGNGANTSNWKTYWNEEYGFEVRYPPDWSIIAGDTGQPAFSPKIGDYIYTRLHVSGTPEYMYSLAHADEDNCPNNMTGAACPRGAKPKEIKEININGISGYFTERESGSLSAYLPRPDKKIAIELNTRHLAYKNVFEQILSTFKFTK